ncbi:MAG: hypothetical protein Q8P26_01185, partial [Candidatus Levybacteria bacterium]|nr:hypothetical protein [Candidatus Levybacteria bacterium]
FSFAKFEQTISLLHPYWPENIFGKVGFMKPEFLILPVLAYTGLFFINGLKKLREKKYILFFFLLGLLGAFLAKGTNGLFGGVYLWLFLHFPGFIMFRDPTKWYALISISYSILMPFTVWKIYEWLRLKSKFSIFNFQFSIKSRIYNFQNLFLAFICFYLLFLIRPAVSGQLTGTFKSHNLPTDYIKLEQFLSKDKNFYRTFWVSAWERFGFRSDTHPAISGKDFINKYNPYDVADYLKNNNSQKILQQLAAKYVIVPFDPQGEIFLKDRKYDDAQYQKTIKDLRSIAWFKEVGGFGKIAVFEVPNPKDHFWTTSRTLSLKYQYISPVEYKVAIKNGKVGDLLIFSENFDSNWIITAVSGIKYKVSSIKYGERFNSFILEKNGNYSLKVYYEPQKWVNFGLWISGITLIIIITVFIFDSKSRKK